MLQCVGSLVRLCSDTILLFYSFGKPIFSNANSKKKCWWKTAFSFCYILLLAENFTWYQRKVKNLSKVKKIVFNGQTSPCYARLYMFVECQDLHRQITLPSSKHSPSHSPAPGVTKFTL